MQVCFVLILALPELHSVPHYHSSGLPCTDTNHRTNSDTYCPSLPPKLDANEMDKSLVQNHDHIETECLH